MIFKSHAKINLSLSIKGTREDGYHDLEMVNLPLDLHDIIELTPLPSGLDTCVVCDDLRLAGLKDNLCKKAFDAMKKEYGFDETFRIHIHKEIPFAAGLGGGSSNAAAVMLALNKILKLGATKEDLYRIGLSLGADVPFFFENKPCLVTGLGEITEPISVSKSYLCLIVKPEEGLRTKDVFALSDKYPRREIHTSDVLKGLATGNDFLIQKSLGNDLMAPAEELLPVIGEIYSSLVKDGFEIVSMSGSGSSLFALTTNVRLFKEAAHRYEKRGYIVCPTKIIH